MMKYTYCPAEKLKAGDVIRDDDKDVKIVSIRLRHGTPTCPPGFAVEVVGTSGAKTWLKLDEGHAVKKRTG